MVADGALCEIVGSLAAQPVSTGDLALPFLCFGSCIVLFQGSCYCVGRFDRSYKGLRGRKEILGAPFRELRELFLEDLVC